MEFSTLQKDMVAEEQRRRGIRFARRQSHPWFQQ